jgi:outer membrane protein assembly factor BamB
MLLLLTAACFRPAGVYVIDYGSLVATSRLLVPKSKKLPAWSVSLDSRGVDDVEFLPNGLVLVGHLDLEPAGTNMGRDTARFQGLYRPVCHSLVAYDQASGRPVWQFDRKRVPLGNSWLLQSGPLVWIRLVVGGGKAQVVALNPDTGKVVAEVEDGAGDVWLPLSNQSELMELSVDEKGVRRRIFSNSDGKLKEESSASLGEPKLNGARLLDQVEVTDGIAALVTNDKGDRVRLIRIGKSQRVLNSDYKVAASTVAMRVGPNGMIAVLARSKGPAQSSATLVDRDGTVVAGLSDAFDDARFLGDHLTVWRQDGFVRSYAVPSGKPEWTVSLGEELVSPPTPWQASVVASGTRRLHCIDSQSGSDRCDVPLPDGFLATRLPDHLVVDGDDLVVVGETGFLRVAGTSPPRVIRSAEWRGTSGASYSAYRTAYRSIVKNVHPGDPAARSRELERTARTLDASAHMITDTATRANEESSRRIAAMNEQMRSSGRSLTPLEIGAQRDAARSSYQSTMAAAQTTAILEGIAAGQQLAALMNEGIDVGQIRREHADALVNFLTTAHLNNLGLNGKLSVRPLLWQAGQGAVVTDLQTGNWLEVATGPPEHLNDEYFFPVSIPFLSPDGRSLVVEGIYGDPKQWRTDDRVHHLTIPRRSLLMFKLSPSDFEPAESYANVSIVPANEEIASVGNYANAVVFH